jgi:O-glycosyl hydrolase
VAVGDDAKSPAPGPVKVHLDQAGKKFTDWGFDIKQSCGKRADDGSCVPPVAAQVAASQAYADEIFKSGDMAVIRIPIRADELGVNASGGVKEGFYKEVIQAVKNAKAANPQVRVFASRSTISDCALESPECQDYADSLKNNGLVVIARYAKLLSQYLTFMDGAGVPIDVLGVENEPHNNFGEGNLATCFKQATDGCADRFYQLIASLKSQHPKPLPQLVGDDAGWPDVDFADALTKDGKWGLLDVITTHYQSGDRKTRHPLLDSLATKAHNHDHPLWDTEYHYDDIAGQGEYSDAALGVFGALDHLDAGFSGITWWSFKPRSAGTSKAQIQSAMVESTANAVPLDTDDGDDKVLERTTFGSRALRHGSTVMVWLVNDTDKPSTGKPIRLLQGTTLVPATGPALYEQWVLKPDGQNGVMSHDAGRAFPVKGDQIVASLPARSITLVAIDK